MNSKKQFPAWIFTLLCILLIAEVLFILISIEIIGKVVHMMISCTLWLLLQSTATPMEEFVYSIGDYAEKLISFGHFPLVSSCNVDASIYIYIYIYIYIKRKRESGGERDRDRERYLRISLDNIRKRLWLFRKTARRSVKHWHPWF